jgi:predicted dehydrogenase
LSGADAAVIASPNRFHLEDLAAAADAGCHVLCEKPVALHAREAAEMVRASEKNDRLLSICFEYRYWEEARYLKDRIAEGELGHVHAVRTWGGSAYGMPHRAHRSRGSGGGGVLSHWTIHNLDLVLWLLGNPEPLTASTYCHQRVRAHPQAAGPSTEGIDPRTILTPTSRTSAMLSCAWMGGRS